MSLTSYRISAKNRHRLLTGKHSLLLIIFFAYISTAYAIDPESKLPIKIESDRATLNDATGISNYSGNVIISQGQSKLEADDISVNAVDRKIVSIEAKGSPAHFTQQESRDASPTHGYADTIIYTSVDATLKLINNARLVQKENSFSGEQIEYDIVKRAIRAKGNEDIGTRVKIQYQPYTSDKSSDDSLNEHNTAGDARQNSDSSAIQTNENDINGNSGHSTDIAQSTDAEPGTGADTEQNTSTDTDANPQINIPANENP